jgi:CRP-like cAMP-binding protein
MTESSAASARARDNALIGRLQQVPLFQRMSVRHLQALRKLARPRPLNKGEILIEEDAAQPGIYVLLKGTLVVAPDSPDVRVLEPLASIGEVAELGAHRQRATVAVGADGVALHLSHELLERVFGRDPDLHQRLSRNLVADLSERLQAANEAQSELGDSRDELMRDLEAAESELNDARMLDSMR